MVVRVAGASGVVPTGQIVLKVGDVRLGSGTLDRRCGRGHDRCREAAAVGTHEVTIRY